MANYKYMYFLMLHSLGVYLANYTHIDILRLHNLDVCPDGYFYDCATGGVMPDAEYGLYALWDVILCTLGAM